MKKALVTGANGFIGSLLTAELMKRGVDVIAADMEGHSDRIPKEAHFAAFDMRDFSTLKKAVNQRDIDTIYHMAWSGASGDARTDYILQADNVKYTCDAIKTASEMGIRRFVGAGSLAQMECLSYIGDNGAAPNAVSCYAAAKIAAQYMSKVVANTLHIEHIWCFIANTYGVGDTTMNFVNFAAKKMLNGERVAFTSAEQNYDFVYITDMTKGLYLCGENGKSNFSYYIGSGKARQLKEYIKIIRDQIDPKIELGLGDIPFKGKSLPMESYSCQQIENDTGYHAEIDFEDGIVKTIDWLKELGK